MSKDGLGSLDHPAWMLGEVLHSQSVNKLGFKTSIVNGTRFTILILSFSTTNTFQLY